MKTSAYLMGVFVLYVAITAINAGSITTGRSFFYGIIGTFIIFCGSYIGSLEKINKELLENSRKFLDYLDESFDDDPDPDDGESLGAERQEKLKTGVVAFQSRKVAS